MRHQESRKTGRDVVHAGCIESWPKGGWTSFLAPSILPAIFHVVFKLRRPQDDGDLNQLTRSQEPADYRSETSCIMIGPAGRSRAGEEDEQE